MGCQTTGQHLNWYKGQQLASNQVGLLKLPRNLMCGYAVMARTLDGKQLGHLFVMNNTTEIELLPGSHTVGLWYFGNDLYSVSEYKITFDCQAGHVYGAFMSPTKVSRHDVDVTIFMGSLIAGRIPLTAWIVDGQTEKVVAGHRDTKYFSSFSCMTGNRHSGKGNRLTPPEYSSHDMINFELSVQVDDLVDQLKVGDVEFKWYAGDKIVSETHGNECSFSFDGVFNTVRLKKAAASFGLGHFKVSASIEGEEVASQEFDIGL
jgi:hypothetical protein